MNPVCAYDASYEASYEATYVTFTYCMKRHVGLMTYNMHFLPEQA